MGDIFYAIGMNITKKACVKHGQTDDTGKKFAKFDEVIAKMKLAAAEPDNSGNYHDYVELCKLYDKNENGTMMLAELAPPEDDDGFIPYVPFLDKLCGKA